MGSIRHSESHFKYCQKDLLPDQSNVIPVECFLLIFIVTGQVLYFSIKWSWQCLNVRAWCTSPGWLGQTGPGTHWLTGSGYRRVPHCLILKMLLSKHFTEFIFHTIWWIVSTATGDARNTLWFRKHLRILHIFYWSFYVWNHFVNVIKTIWDENVDNTCSINAPFIKAY